MLAELQLVSYYKSYKRDSKAIHLGSYAIFDKTNHPTDDTHNTVYYLRQFDIFLVLKVILIKKNQLYIVQ